MNEFKGNEIDKRRLHSSGTTFRKYAPFNQKLFDTVSNEYIYERKRADSVSSIVRHLGLDARMQQDFNVELACTKLGVLPPLYPLELEDATAGERGNFSENSTSRPENDERNGRGDLFDYK